MMSEDERSLQEIREALRMADEKRLDPELTQEQRELLEMSALALRDAERLAIARVQKKVYKDMEQLTATLNSLSRRIRTRVTRMNKVPKALDAIKTVIKEVVKVLVAVGKW